MVKNYTWRMLVRLLLLVLTIAAIFYFIDEWPNYVLLSALGLLAIKWIYDLYWMLNQTNRDFTTFLMSIYYDDFANTYTAGTRGKSYDELYKAFNLINQKFKNLQAEKEANHHYLQTIVEQVSTGLLCVDAGGRVVLMNRALQKMLHKPVLLHLQGLSHIDPALMQLTERLQPGDSELIRIKVEQKTVPFSISTAEFILRGTQHRLFAFQNLESELEEQELASWQKLIRILTHEIMNSVAPITSLTATVNGLLSQEGSLDSSDKEDIKAALAAIGKRSEGLLHFTETYRQLARIPVPNLQEVHLQTLLKRVLTLLRPAAHNKNIRLEEQLPVSALIVQADPDLLEQVIINLVKNAMDALRDTPDAAVAVQAGIQDGGKTFIRIADNGPGITPEIMDQIFVPFYTTKKDGSGIGLSLSRQIMRLHKGTISVQSVPGEGAVFTLTI